MGLGDGCNWSNDSCGAEVDRVSREITIGSLLRAIYCSVSKMKTKERVVRPYLC
jgi:hypothetical protein